MKKRSPAEHQVPRWNFALGVWSVTYATGDLDSVSRCRICSNVWFLLLLTSSVSSSAFLVQLRDHVCWRRHSRFVALLVELRASSSFINIFPILSQSSTLCLSLNINVCMQPAPYFMYKTILLSACDCNAAASLNLLLVLFKAATLFLFRFDLWASKLKKKTCSPESENSEPRPQRWRHRYCFLSSTRASSPFHRSS